MGVGSFTPWSLYPWRKALCTHWIGGWVGLRIGMDAAVKKKDILSLLLVGLNPDLPQLYKFYT
jgi:hypothetical protein